jgi:hypothetical protein
MPSPLARFLDFAVSAQFREDSRGRLVFLPLITKREAYFVDSPSDAEKLRALARMYRGASAVLNLMWSLLNFIAVLAPGSVSSYYGGYVPLRAKLTAIAWVAVPSLLFWATSAWVVWSLYKQAIKKFTQALPPASPEVVAQLPAPSRRPQRIALVVLGAVTILVGVAILAAVQRSHP